MRDARFHPRMTRGTQRHEIFQVVSKIDEEMIAPTFDVVHIQSPAAWAAFGAAQATSLVTLDDDLANALPAPPMLEPSPAAIIGVIVAGRPILGAGVGAKLTAPLSFAGERPVGLAALRTGERLRCHQPSIAACPGAMMDVGVGMPEGGAARSALDHARVGNFVSGVAPLRAKALLGWLLDHMARALKSFPAVPARKRRAIFHRDRVASLPAEDRRRVVGLKFTRALGASLEQN